MGFPKGLLTTGLVAGSVAIGLAVFNKVTQSMAGELDTVLTGEERRYPWKYGDIFYQVKGARGAKPLVLIHSFGPGASSYEWRKSIDALAEQFRVYALDLLGFGLSDRPPIDYAPETNTDLIGDFIKEVINKPAIVAAHGLACAYIVTNAYRHPQLFERLVLVAPPQTILQESVPSLLDRAWQAILRTPILGEFIHNLLNSRSLIRNYYDVQGYYNFDLITNELVEYIYTSAHQSNSRYAQASVLSNHLSLDVHEPLAGLQVPIVAIWGRQGMFTSEASAAFKRVNPYIDVRILEQSSFELQDERASAFNNLVKEFASVAAQ